MLLVPAPEQHASERRIACGRVQQPPGNATEPLGHRMVAVDLGLLHQAGTPALGVAVHLVQQMLLAAEMPIDGSLGDAGAGRDRRRGRRPEADGGVEVECCTEQTLAGGLTVTS
jgi:hypothetical protein